MRRHLLFYAIVAISAMAQDTAEKDGSTQTPQLQIIPECARSCISRWIPDFLTNPDKTCSDLEGSGNPYFTETSQDIARQEILNCIIESNSKVQAYTDTAANVGSLRQPSLSTFSTLTSSEPPSPTSSIITTTLPTDLSPSPGKQKQVESSPISMPPPSDPQADTAAIPTATPASSATKNNLSPGVIAGIAIGGFILLLLIFALIFFWRRKKQHHIPEYDSLESGNRPAVWITPPVQNFSRVHCRTASESSCPISPVSPLKSHNGQESTTTWSPGSPVSPVFSPVGGQHKRNISVESVTSITSLNDLEEEPEFEEVAINTVSSKATMRSSIARADSVAWRKEVESAKERAARRVSQMSNPNMSENGGSQSSRNSRGSGKLSFGKWSRK